MSDLTLEDLKAFKAELKSDLREFLTLSLSNLLAEVSRLAGLLERTDQSVRNIELNTNTRIATMQKDIDNLYEELEQAKRYNSVEKEEGSRQAADMSLQSEIKIVKDEFRAYKEAQDKKWTDQAVVNSGVSTLTKLLWAILTICLGILAGFIWQLILQGGLKGLVGP